MSRLLPARAAAIAAILSALQFFFVSARFLFAWREERKEFEHYACRISRMPDERISREASSQIELDILEKRLIDCFLSRGTITSL